MAKTITKATGLLAIALLLSALFVPADSQARPNSDTRKALKIQNSLQETIDKVVPTFVKVAGGSGVLISEDGYFITNFHVVNAIFKKVDTTTVMLPNGRSYTARKVSLDPYGDTALCKICLKDTKEKLPFATMGDSDKLEIGQPVIAVGNPLGLGSGDAQPTVTFGVVSAKNRYIAASRNNMLIYGDAVMIDLSINPGNSGGPLFDTDGNLLGINGLIYTRFGHKANTGVGYAVSINQIKRFLPIMKKKPVVYHGTIQGISFGKQNEQGNPLINKIEAGSLAAKTGFKRGDAIFEVNGKPVKAFANFLRLIHTCPENTEFSVKVKRGNQKVTLKFRSERIPLPGTPTAPTNLNKPTLGVELDMNFKGKGVKIKKVVAGSGAAEAGITAGDIIIKVDGKNIKSIADLRKILAVKKASDKVMLTVRRGRRTINVMVLLKTAQDVYKNQPRK